MDITVEVYCEILTTGERKLANTAHVVFVAIDATGKPVGVPRLIPGTEEEKSRFAAAKAYREEHGTR
jgi:acyl-CoA hydrolase